MNNSSQDILNKIKDFAKDESFGDELVEGFSDILNKLSNQSTIDENMAKNLGQFFYYYSQIDEILSNIIKSLLPELDHKIMGIDSSYRENAFKKKVILIKSITPNSKELKVFDLLEKINSARNKLAHSAPDKLELKKINDELIRSFKQSFSTNTGILDRVTNKSHIELNRTVKIIMITKMYLELFFNIEALGKNVDENLKLFESVRKFSSLYVRRRFSILTYQIQTGVKSENAPENFKLMSEFSNIIEEISFCVKKMFK